MIKILFSASQKDWEKYNVNKTVTEVYSPTQVQRSFPVILEKKKGSVNKRPK